MTDDERREIREAVGTWRCPSPGCTHEPFTFNHTGEVCHPCVSDARAWLSRGMAGVRPQCHVHSPEVPLEFVGLWVPSGVPRYDQP